MICTDQSGDERRLIKEGHEGVRDLQNIVDHKASMSTQETGINDWNVIERKAYN